LVSASAGAQRGSVKGRAGARPDSSPEIHAMKRSAFFFTQSIAVIGTVVLTLALTGCGTLQKPMPDDAPSGIVPPGRGAL
jgi:hypothetical protein